MTTPVQGPQGQNQRPEYVDLALKAAREIFDRFASKHGVSIEQLGPEAKKIADGMYKLFEGGAKKDGKVLSELKLHAFQQLRHAFELDNAAKFDAGAPPAVAKPSDGQIPAKTKFIVPAEGGKYALGGTVGPEHLLTKLLHLVGLNPKSFSAKVAEVIDGSASSAKFSNLTDGGVWKELGRKLRQIAVEEGVTGGPKPEALQRAAANAAAAIGHGTTTQQTGLGAVPKQGLGLETTAAKTSNTGSATNSMSIRAQLLAGIKSQGAGVDKAAADLTNALLVDLKAGEVTPNLKAEIAGVLREILKDPRSTDGTVKASTVLANVYGELLKRAPEDQKKSVQAGHDFATQLAGALDAHKGGLGLDKACSDMALGAMKDLVGAMLGKPIAGPSPATLSKMSAILTSLATPKKTAAAQTRTPTPPPAAEAKTEAKKSTRTEAPKTEAKDETPAMARGREAARKLLEALNIDVSDGDAKKVSDAFAGIYASAKSGHSGEVALHGVRYLVDKAGMPPAFLEHFEGILASYAQGSQEASARAKQYEGEIKGLEAQKAKTTDTAAIADLDKAITNAKTNLGEMKKAIADKESAFQTAEFQALQMVAHAVLAPDDFKAKYVTGHDQQQPQAQTATGGAGGGANGGAGGVGGAGGGGGDNGGPGNVGGGDERPNLFPPRDDLVSGRLPGIFSAAGPTDTDPSKLSLQEARARECAMILRDPSLSIEDKIFLFMMMFVAFTDRERENQLEEIVGLDRDQARRAKLKDDKQREKTSMLVEQRGAQDELRAAEGQRDALKGAPDSDAFKAAQKKVDDLTGKVNACKTRVDEISREYEKIRRDSDKAPQSREVKFTELQRLSQLRDNILNMARSIMETSNRNVEKVFR